MHRMGTYSWKLLPCRVHSATDAGGTPVPLDGSHTRPPLQPPSRHEFGPGFVLKSQLRRPQIRPAFQLSGTLKVTEVNAPASQPAGKSGFPLLEPVKWAGQIVNGHAEDRVSPMSLWQLQVIGPRTVGDCECPSSGSGGENDGGDDE